MKQILVIPARMKGKRLPGKPLISILGKPMLLWVWEQCKKVINKKELDHYIKNYNYVKKDKLEGLEINGMIECDIKVYAIKMIGDSWAVDTKKDLKFVEKILKAKKHSWEKE